METDRKKDWLGRNWKWFVPLACLWGAALVAGFVALILYLVFGLMKTNDAYKEALARAKADPAVIAALGVPIEEGLFVSGSINVSGPSGEAELAIPISGPQGKGTIYLEARKSAGRWRFGRLQVEISGSGKRIDLLGPGDAPEVPGQGPDKGPALII